MILFVKVNNIFFILYGLMDFKITGHRNQHKVKFKYSRLIKSIVNISDEIEATEAPAASHETVDIKQQRQTQVAPKRAQQTPTNLVVSVNNSILYADVIEAQALKYYHRRRCPPKYKSGTYFE